MLSETLKAVLLTCLAVGLSSIVYALTYRALVHPLARYPGPFLAKFTNLYSAWHAWKGDIHLDMWRCYLKYGDHIRYAPNRVLINNGEAIQDAYGHSAHVKKFEGYKVLATHAPNILTLADKAQHARRKRVVSQAFSESSMKMFEPILLSKIDIFCQRLRAQHQDSNSKWTGPYNMAKEFKYFTFDLLNAVAFGVEEDTMRDTTHRFVLDAMAQSNIRLGATLQATELTFARLDKYIMPKQSMAGLEFVKFLRKLFRSRVENKTQSQDIFSFLQQCKDPVTGESLSARELSSETAVFFAAGSDTGATTSAAVSHYLSHSPRCYRRAAEEVRTNFASVDEIRLGPKLNSCVYLRACIDETMRLTPPGGAAFWRVVETGGTSIGGTFIPEGCEVGVGTYIMHHHPSYWDKPFSFTPERWLEERVGSKAPYFPFNIGSRGCVGKPLAIAQLMLSFSRLLWEFDFRTAEGGQSPVPNDPQSGSDEKFEEYVLKDHIIGQGDGPVLYFKARH